MTSYPVLENLAVTVDPDGSVRIHADALTAARLAGRDIFGAIAETQTALKDRIADAWYAADCPGRDPA